MDPKVLINLLVELAKAEVELLEARQLQSGDAIRSQSLDELQDEYRQDAEEAEAAEQELRRRLHRSEAELEDAEKHLRERRQLLPMLADQRQADAVRREIESLELRVTELEAEALGMLEDLGTGSEETAEARRLWREQESKRLAAQESMSDRSERASVASEVLVAEIDRLMALLPPDVQRQVRRLRGGLDRAVVFHEAAACGGCFAQLPRQQAIAAEKGSAVVRCESCSRYVVHHPWH